jgi:hypothetical protein
MRSSAGVREPALIDYAPQYVRARTGDQGHIRTLASGTATARFIDLKCLNCGINLHLDGGDILLSAYL